MSTTRKEVSANMYSHSEVDLICVLARLALIYDHSHGDTFTEVIRYKRCDDFLGDILNLLCMKVDHADSILSLTINTQSGAE